MGHPVKLIEKVPKSFRYINLFFLYFVIDFLTGNNRDFILFCHTMAEKLTNVKKQVEKIFFHLFLGKTSGKKIFPLVFRQTYLYFTT